MSTRTATRTLVFLALAATLSAGCVVHERSADVTFTWDPAACLAASGGRYVDIVFEDLDDGSVDEVDAVPCDVGGVGLEDLDPAFYVVSFYPSGIVQPFFQEQIRLRGGDNEFTVYF